MFDVGCFPFSTCKHRGLFAPDPSLDALQVPDEVGTCFKDLGDYDYRPPREVTDARLAAILRNSIAPPGAFRRHNATMAANIVNSRRPAQLSAFVVRAFAKIRSTFRDTSELAKKLGALEQELKTRLDIHEAAVVAVLCRFLVPANGKGNSERQH